MLRIEFAFPAPSDDEKPTYTRSERREKQIELLMGIIDAENMNPLDIPDGGKSKLRAICIERHPRLFTDSGFDHMWKVAKNDGLIEIMNPERYS